MKDNSWSIVDATMPVRVMAHGRRQCGNGQLDGKGVKQIQNRCLLPENRSRLAC